MSDERATAPAAALETALVGATFVVLGLVGIANHEMWRDELEIWLIARDSGSVGQLFHNMGTQGHPAVWYLLNYVLTRFTTNPLAMQLANLAIGTSAAILFYRHAPFSRLQRLLFCCGYFMLFEYTIISRSYALGLLLVFAFCIRFRRLRRLDLGGAVLLVVLANTTVYSMIIAAHIVLLVALQALFADRTERPWFDRRWLTPLAIVLMGVALSFGHTWAQARAMGPAHVGAYSPTHDVTWVASCLSTIVRGAVPLPDFSEFHFWNSNLLQMLPPPMGIYLGALLAVVLLVLATWRFRGRPALSLVFILGSATMLSITFFVWYGWVRHHGQVFLWYVVCCWLWYGLGSTRTTLSGKVLLEQRTSGALLTVLLLLQTLAGAHAYAMDLLHPFSNAKATGRHLSRGELQDVTLVGSVDYSIQPVAAYLDQPFYYPESGEFRTFLDWGPSRRLVSVETVLRDSLRLLDEHRRDVVLVSNFQPGSIEPGQSLRLGQDAKLQCFARFVGALVPDENYHLCRVHASVPTPTRPDIDSPTGGTDNYDPDMQKD